MDLLEKKFSNSIGILDTKKFNERLCNINKCNFILFLFIFIYFYYHFFYFIYFILFIFFYLFLGLKGKENYEKAFELYMESSNKYGLDKSEYKLGLFYEKGLGVEKDIKKAVEYYTLSSNKGNIFSKQKLDNLKNNPKFSHLFVDEPRANFRDSSFI